MQLRTTTTRMRWRRTRRKTGSSPAGRFAAGVHRSAPTGLGLLLDCCPQNFLHLPSEEAQALFATVRSLPSYLPCSRDASAVGPHLSQRHWDAMTAISVRAHCLPQLKRQLMCVPTTGCSGSAHHGRPSRQSLTRAELAQQVRCQSCFKTVLNVSGLPPLMHCGCAQRALNRSVPDTPSPLLPSAQDSAAVSTLPPVSNASPDGNPAGSKHTMPTPLISPTPA